jgi:hypothetical protein
MPPIASGVKARYRIPALNAFPGRSPICCTERVQIEHWASIFSDIRPNPAIPRMTTNFFTLADWIQKYDFKDKIVRHICALKAKARINPGLLISSVMINKHSLYPTSSVFNIFWNFFRLSSSSIVLRRRIIFGVTSIHSSCCIYSIHSSSVI